MTSLYEYLKNDREDVLGRMSQTLIKRMYLSPQYHKDALHECYLAWMEAEFNPFFENESIISYAFKCAGIRLSAWRRRVLLAACTTRVENPEPSGMSLEELHGEWLEMFIDETTKIDDDPLEKMILLEEGGAEKEEEEKIIIFPKDKNNIRNYGRILEMLQEGFLIKEIAQELEVHERTIYRRAMKIHEENYSNS